MKINIRHSLTLRSLLVVIGILLCQCAPVSKDKNVEYERFSKTKLSDNLDEPLEIAVTHEDKVVIIERKGAVKLFLPEMNITKTLATLPVFFGIEDGLLGVTLDPEFAVNHFVYFFYSPAGEKPIQRVSRFLLEKDSLYLNSEKVILEIPTQREDCCHSAGSLAFGPDNNLFIAVGDNTNPHNPGYFNSIDERKGREHWDAQRTAGNTNDLRGKILRIHIEADGSYTIPDGNLFEQGNPMARAEIYAMGCRNPYRISVDAKRDWLFWGDVGQNTINNPARGPVSYDEWHVATKAGFFGWPYFAGPSSPYADFDFETEKVGAFFDPKNPINNSVNNTGLKELPPAINALIWYSYDDSKLFKHLGTGGKSPIAGPVYYSDHYSSRTNDTTKHLPTYYDGKLFIAEWMRDWINVVTLTPDGKVDSIEQFMASDTFNHPIDLELGPAGQLYVLEYGTYWFSKNKDAGLYRIDYNRGNREPIVHVNANQTIGPVPLTVTFSSSGTYDPDSPSKLAYSWYFDSNEVQSTDPNPSFTFNKVGEYSVRLVVADQNGKTSQQKVNIKVGNALPKITLQVKGNRTFYWDNKPIGYSLDVSDKEDGSLRQGTISTDDVNLTMSYSTMGTDMAMVAQSHEGAEISSPGYDLIKASDCKACHGIKEKSVGPSYADVSKRYATNEKNIAQLAEKIIKGGNGMWGENAMSAHPQISKADAETMVRFILSLKDQRSYEKRIPVSGELFFQEHLKEPGGRYVISASYKDKGQPIVGANTVKENFYFKSAKLSAVSADADYGVAKTSESIARFTTSGAWLAFKQIDMQDLKSLAFYYDARQIGGELTVRLDALDGDVICRIKIEQDKSKRVFHEGEVRKGEGWGTIVEKLVEVKGIHDVYLLYEDLPNNQSTMFRSLSLDWVEFRNK